MTDPPPLSADDAAKIAGRWALKSRPDSGGRVCLREYPFGFVAWPEPPESAPRQGLPTVVGAPRLVIALDGEVTVWPSLHPDLVAKLYESDQRGDNRFPATVREVLTAGGWAPGRDVSESIARWEAGLSDAHAGAGLDMPMSAPARAALAEFGGLRLCHGRIALAVWPDAGPIDTARYAQSATCLGTVICPFARLQDGVSDLAIAADGQVFLLGITGQVLVAEHIDDALTAALLGTSVFPSCRPAPPIRATR